MSTKTTIEKKTYQKDGKWYEDETKTISVTENGSTSTTVKTTTRELDSFDTSKMAEALGDSSSKTKKEKKGFLSKLTDGFGSDSDSDDEDDKKFAKKFLKLVNEKRKLHKVKALKMSKDLTESSKKWAEKIAKTGEMEHSPDKEIGENIFGMSCNITDFQVTAEQVVDKWYKEMENHDFSKEPEGGLLKTANFSQMIWKNATHMGVTKIKSKDGLLCFVVAHFSPRGLWGGEFTSQVPPVGGFPKKNKAEKKDSSSSSSSSDSSSDEEDFKEDFLKAHNKYRAKHGVKALKYDKKIAKYAQEWANTIAKKDRMEHRPSNDRKYGENLFNSWSSNPNHKVKGNEAVDAWYSEIKDYTFGQEPSRFQTKPTGHFTQVVWADSEKVGSGIAKSKSGNIYVVANYDPPGNWVGSYSSKVPAPK